MKFKTKLVAILIIVAIIAVIIPIISSNNTVYAANTDVSITGKSVMDIETEIQDILDLAAVGDTITVTGSKTGIIDESLLLDIPANIKVIWKAEFSGSFSNDYEGLIFNDGNGTFEVATGGMVSVTNDGATIGSLAIGTDVGGLYVSGGTVTANGTEVVAIYGNSIDSHIIITEGNVTATGTGSRAICLMDTHLVVYLSEIVTGDITVNNIYSDILEIDTLAIPISRDGTYTGITMHPDSYNYGKDGCYIWDTTRVVPYIITLGGYDVTPWGSYSTTYTVTYNLNGGTGTVPTESDKVASATFTAKASSGITAPAGKQFKEWNTKSDGSGTKYVVGATVTMPASALTLYAIYEDVSITPPIYTITSGANGTWKQDSTDGLTITSDGDFAKFTGLKVNGVILDTSNYTAVSGSTVVTLKPSYLGGLAIGTYGIEFLYSDGSTRTTFTIAKADTGAGKTDKGEAAKTGEVNFVILASVIAVLSISGLVVTYIISKKKRA